MSYRLRFEIAEKFLNPYTVPKGTLARIMAEVEASKSLQNFAILSNDALCELAERFNSFVEEMYTKLHEWAKSQSTGDTEIITPEQSKQFIPYLQTIDIPIERWTKEYYVHKMEKLYSILRGEHVEGYEADIQLGTDAARSTMAIIQDFLHLDTFDVRMDVPYGHDFIIEGDWLTWCEPHSVNVLTDQGCPFTNECSEECVLNTAWDSDEYWEEECGEEKRDE